MMSSCASGYVDATGGAPTTFDFDDVVIHVTQ
jgi:hypothetical protein